MPQRVGNIELYMGPQQVGGPDDLRQAVVDFIDGARRRLDIAVQLTQRLATPENGGSALQVLMHGGAGAYG